MINLSDCIVTKLFMSVLGVEESETNTGEPSGSAYSGNMYAYVQLKSTLTSCMVWLFRKTGGLLKIVTLNYLQSK
jgi:hypothetical protein